METQSLKSMFLVARIVAFAFASSVAFYYFAVRLLGDNFKSASEPMPEQSLQIIQFAFLAVCISAVIGIQFYKKMILSGKANLKLGPEKLIFNFTLFSLFVAELPGLLGLILYIIGRNLTHFYIAIGIALALLIVFFPRYAKWEEWIKQIGKKN